MGADQEVKIRHRILIKGEVQDRAYWEEIKKKASWCGVGGVVRNTSDGRLEIILEGERKAVSTVIVWLTKQPHVHRVVRWDSDTETFLDEFKSMELQTA